uniref:MATH domain-containing protein n=1 Tax=Meloidogyne floridensis TaxID=298350 RepID=A0A915NSY9_9BILA
MNKIIYLLFLLNFLKLNYSTKTDKITESFDKVMSLESKLETIKNHIEEHNKLNNMYLEYLKQPKENEFLQKISLHSYVRNFQMFISNFFGNKIIDDPMEEARLNYLVGIPKSEEGEKEGYGWSIEFGIAFKNVLDGAKELIVKYTQIYMHNKWTMEKMFCEHFCFINSVMKNKKLSENKYVYLKIHPSSGKGEWKSLDIKDIIAKVWNYKKDVLKLIFEAFYFVDNDTIETASINVMGILERIKLWIEGKMGLDNNQSQNENKLFDIFCKELDDILYRQEYNGEVDKFDKFIRWVKTENYKTMKKLLIEKNSLLYSSVIEGIKEGSTLELIENNIKVFINDDNLKEIMNLIKDNKKQNKKEIKLNIKNEKKKIKKEEEVKKKIEIEMKKEEEMKIKMNLKNKNNENVKTNYKNKDKPKSERDEENIKITHELSKNDDEINEEERQIKYFIEDKNLFEIFNKFNKGKTEIGRNLLNICIFANEIGKRFEFFEKLKLKNKLVFNVYFEEEKFLE